MAASLDNPIYTVYMVDGTTKYNLTPATLEINLANQEKQVAQCATIDIVNIRTSGGETLCQLLQVRKRIFIYANDGSRSEEVFRGWTWTKYHQSDVESSIITVKAYDNLIYLQESEDSLYFSKGNDTKSVMQTICNRWGIQLNYTYSTITHSKLVLRGTLTDIFMSDVLDLVKERTGKKYVITSQKDVMNISTVGTNTTIYKIEKKNNAITVRYETSMDGMITKVVILGKADSDSEKQPVVATVAGNTSQYGTLQKLQDKDEDTSLADAKKEAQNTINEKGKPTVEYEVETNDIPWIKKGDLVYVNAGHIGGRNLIAVGIERTISNTKKTMTLSLIDP